MDVPAPPDLSALRLEPTDLERFVELNVDFTSLSASRERCTALRSILAGVAKSRSLESVPAIIGAAMRPFGWLWNGFYVLRGDGKLHLGPAYGPPVCSELERSGGPLTSGMCFDALLLNQTLAAFDAKAWPGYVSCDGASGLATVSGIVCPIRDASGRPFAVWDLDATGRIEPVDVRFMDVLFATLARCEGSAASFTPAALGGPVR